MYDAEANFKLFQIVSCFRDFFRKTVRISTMHVLRMIVAKADESQGLRINYVLCFSTFILQQTENLSFSRLFQGFNVVYCC